jgi:uncharacterized phage infection (PIP) family protein YhgE
MEYSCKLCDKKYSTYKSLWNHNKIKHSENVVQSHTSVVQQDTNGKKEYEKDIDKNICKYCNKKFCDRTYRWRHEQKCKAKNNELTELKEEIEKLKQQINATKSNVQNAHSITNNIDNSQKIINNFGSNNLDCLTVQFKKKLLKEFLFEEDFINPIPLLIEKINFNSDYKENNNAKISNLRSKIGYKYTEGKWKAVEKEKLLNELYKIGDDIIDNIINNLEHVPKNVQDGYDNFIGKKELLKKQIKTKIEVACYLYFKNIEEEKDIEI